MIISIVFLLTKDILEKKNEEIRNLKSHVEIKSSASSSDSAEKSPIAALNAVLSEREAKIEELQVELLNAAREMDDITNTIHKLTREKDINIKKVNKLTSVNEELTQQKLSLQDTNKHLHNQIMLFEKRLEERDKAASINK